MKRAMIVACVLGAAVSASALPVFYWGSDGAIGEGFGPDIYNELGFAMPTSSTYAVEMRKQADDGVVLTAAPSFWYNMATPGVGYNPAQAAVAAWSNLTVYTRIFNNANPLLATMYADTGLQTLTWSDNPTPATELFYEIGPVSQSDWKLIPEPAAAGFVLAGLGALLVRRIRRRN